MGCWDWDWIDIGMFRGVFTSGLCFSFRLRLYIIIIIITS